jgi:PAS domain S-box-containing protein
MNKIHKTTTLAAILTGMAFVLLALGYSAVPAILAVVAFFAALRELPIYTSTYQFVIVTLSCIALGASIDLPEGHFPLTTLAMIFFTCVPVIRIAFFPTFSYTGYSWFEPLMTALGIATLVISNLIFPHHWSAWLIPAPIALFCIVFAWGTTNDKNQLLKSARGGYRVQTGKPANEFELPDQDGKPVKLSDFKDKRHVLLIFVRGDWCPGCHMMLRTYEKNNDKFRSKNVLVMAIGPDPVGVNRNMVEKLGLDFKVLSDEGQRTAMIYGVQLKEYDNAFAEKYEEGIPLPASFLIDKSGIVRYVSRPDKVGEFLNPSLIFPIVDQLDGSFRHQSETASTELSTTKSSAVSKEELKDVEHTISNLKKELNRYQSIIEQANDAMIVIDIVDGTIHQSNPSAATLLGYSREELQTLTLFDLQPKELLNDSSKIVADVWEKGGLIYTDIPFVTKSGEQIPVECSAKVAPFEGRPAIVIYARDIRERLKMEREINEQRKIIDEKNKDITDSIEYSKRIQRSIFIDKEQLKTHAPESFILFKPRDVVSGDFYWFCNYEIKRDVTSSTGFHYKEGSHILVVAAVDCTGHGVPGAFMSIIGNTLLNQTLNSISVDSAGTTLDYVNTELKKSLNKNSEDIPLRDGMDIGLCYFDLENKRLEFAGANNPAYIIRNEELIVLAADKQPITASTDVIAKPFKTKVFELQQGDTVYLFTDGFADQFGGQKGKKFMYKRFKETLLGIQNQSMDIQKDSLDRIFEDWKGELEQVDDVLVIGIRV